MGAAADCERMIGGWLGQPVNTLTTLAFVVAGAVVVGRRPHRAWVGMGLVATGIGSFLFHGPMPLWSEWAHDVTLAWLVLLVAATALRRERLAAWPGLFALGVVFAVLPELGDPVAVALTVVAGVLLLGDRSQLAWGPVALLAAVAVFGRLGATGGPLCRPDSPLQPHGVWQVGAAVAVAWWAMRSRSPQ